MEEKRFIINYYKNADSGIHIQKIRSSTLALTPHSHEYFQIYYILQGTLLHTTECCTSALTRGDAFIIPPGCTHSVKEQKDTLFYTFAFTRESLASAYNSLPLVTQFLLDLSNTENVHAKISIKNDNLIFVEELMEKIYREFEEKQIGYIDALHAYATSLLVILARYHFENTPLTIPKSSNRARIISSMKFIDANFAKQLTLDDMAKRTAMSKSEFCRQFREFSGTTFQKYLHTARINYAASLIKKDYGITAVHTLCGYNDFSTFYRNFKRMLGCSPMQYRKIAVLSSSTALK